MSTPPRHPRSYDPRRGGTAKTTTLSHVARVVGGGGLGERIDPHVQGSTEDSED